MAASQLDVDRLASAVVSEIPTNSISTFLKHYSDAASGGNCGGGCGGGCCGAACHTPNTNDLGVIDTYGHTGLSSASLNDIGATKLDALRTSIKAKLATAAAQV